MVDGDRVYPVNFFFLHHSTGPEFANADDIEVQDWYSSVGKGRGYAGGALNPRHEHPSRPGQLTYAMAQFTLREYTKDGNKYGWRLTDLVKNPWQNVTWSVGDWSYNQKSCSVEVCGDYSNKVLPDKALMLIADYLRPIDQELGGQLSVWLHKEVFNTACPARIAEQRNTIIDMINNPDKWNKQLWPESKPVEPPKTVKWINMDIPRVMRAKEDIRKIDPDTKKLDADVALRKGDARLFLTKAIVDGKVYVRTEFDTDNNISRGYTLDQLEDGSTFETYLALRLRSIERK